jgi:hypothetical protein
MSNILGLIEDSWTCMRNTAELSHLFLVVLLILLLLLSQDLH